MNHPLQEYYFRPRRVCLPPFIPQFGKGTRPPKPRYGGPKMSYHRARVIVDSGGNLRNVLSMGCASNSESGFSDDPDITIIKRKIFKRVKRDDNRNIVDNPAIKLSRFKNLKPKVGFKAKLGTKNAILVEIVREIYRFIKFAPNRRKLMYNEKIIPFYNVYNWGPVRKKTAATRVDGLFLLLKQMMDNAPDHPCEPMCFSRNRDICGSFYIGAPDNLGGQLYGRWLNDYRKNTKMSHHKKIIYPLVHECQDFFEKLPYDDYDLTYFSDYTARMRRYQNIQLTYEDRNEGALDIHTFPKSFMELQTSANFIASVAPSDVKGKFYEYLTQVVPESCIVYRQPYRIKSGLCRMFVDPRFYKQHKLLPGYFMESVKPDPWTAHDCWEQALRRVRYQVYVSKVTDKLLYHKMLKSGDDLIEEDLCEDCHSSVVTSYAGDNEPKRRYTLQMAKQGAMYAYVNATIFNRKSPTRLSVLFRILMKRYLENDNIRREWEELHGLPSERKLSYKLDTYRLATGYRKRWYVYPSEWDMYTFIKSLVIIHSGVLGHWEQPICHSPQPSDNEEEVRFFRNHHFPPSQDEKKKIHRNIKRIPDALGKIRFKRLMHLRRLFKDKQMMTRSERAELFYLRRLLRLYMLTKREKRMLRKLKKVRRFFIKRRFKYYKRKHTNRIEWRTTPIYSIKKNSPFTHDEIAVMCIGNGNIHYIGKLTRKEILLLTETAEEYHKNGLLNIDKNKAYILGTVIPLIKGVTRLNKSLKLKILNSKKYGKTFRNKFGYLLHKSSKAVAKATLLDKNVDITCEHCRCLAHRVLTRGDYKCDPHTFIERLSGQLTKLEQLARAAVRVNTLRHRVIKNFTFKMWECENFGNSFFQYVPTRDLAKLSTVPGNLFYNTNNTPYNAYRTSPLSFYRLVQVAIAAQRLKEQCFKRLIYSRDLLKVFQRLLQFTRLRKSIFIRALCKEVVFKCIAFISKKKNTFCKLTKVNKSIRDKRKLRFRAKRLGRTYTTLARTVNNRLQERLHIHPGFQQEMFAYKGQNAIRSKSSSRQRIGKDKTNGDCHNPLCDEENISPMMVYRNSIDNLKKTNQKKYHDDFLSIQETIIRRYRTLISELRKVQQVMRPKTLTKRRKNRKRKCFLVIRSMYKNLKVGKINSHRIRKSMNVWRKYDAHIRNLMDDFNDHVEMVLNSKVVHWLPEDKPDPNLHLFEFEKPKTPLKPEVKLNECTYNQKLRVLINNKNKKILGGYRTLKLGTDWTAKYHEIIQRKFIKVEHFHQQKDSYAIQAGKMAAKGCEKVVKKCLYALRLFGISKRDLELALLVYAKIRIMVKMEPLLRYPCKDKLVQEAKFLNSKFEIYTEAIEQHHEKISKFQPQFISWRRQDINFMNKVLVEHCDKPKVGIEKYFYGLDLKQAKNRKYLDNNELFDLHDYKYYDYKSDDDFSHKLDYSSDSSRENLVEREIDCCCTCEGDDESQVDKNAKDKNNNGRRISLDLDLKELISPDAIDDKDNIISIIQNRHTSIRTSQFELETNNSNDFSSGLYVNSNNFHRNSRKSVIKYINRYKYSKRSRWIKVSTDNDSSSTSYGTKFRRTYFQTREDMKSRIPHIIESNVRIQLQKKEKREVYSLRMKYGGEICWRKPQKKLENIFDTFMDLKFSNLLFKCHDYSKHYVPEYHPIYYLRHLPVIKERDAQSLMFTSIANFRKELFEKLDKKQFDPSRRGTEDMDIGSLSSDSDQTLSSESENKRTVESDSFYEKLFLSKYNDTYQKLKGNDLLKLKEEVRNEIENFKQLLRYEKECLQQDPNSNDILMEIAEKVEENHPTEESVLGNDSFRRKRFRHEKYGKFKFDPYEWYKYFEWVKRKACYGNRRAMDFKKGNQK
ncbi:uncharacterized protein [Halyomorpha halys]|uniref:uncharacterized protein n=1 Tax=Halyomorpha halys TaxID=286706 RepID=UPI0006D4C81A